MSVIQDGIALIHRFGQSINSCENGVHSQNFVLEQDAGLDVGAEALWLFPRNR